ncbi:MAG: hypothetical protein GY719_11260 [bacterium]|nr:hypothetical protein [bacterium]
MDPVTDRKKSVDEVLSANRRFARSTARALAKLLTPELEDGRPLPDLLYLQQLAARALERRWHRLHDADEARHDALADRHAVIVTRDEQVGLLYRELVDLRSILRGRFGAARSKNFIGLRGHTSRDPTAILTQADRAVTRLRDPERPLPSSKIPVTNAARARWAVPVAEAADALRATARHVVAAIKNADLARRERKLALAEFNRVFVLIAGWFEGLYRLAGREDRAELVRPSRRHPGKTYLEVKKAERAAAGPGSKASPGVATRLIAPIRRIFDQRRSA